MQTFVTYFVTKLMYKYRKKAKAHLKSAKNHLLQMKKKILSSKCPGDDPHLPFSERIFRQEFSMYP